MIFIIRVSFWKKKDLWGSISVKKQTNKQNFYVVSYSCIVKNYWHFPFANVFRSKTCTGEKPGEVSMWVCECEGISRARCFIFTQRACICLHLQAWMWGFLLDMWAGTCCGSALYSMEFIRARRGVWIKADLVLIEQCWPTTAKEPPTHPAPWQRGDSSTTAQRVQMKNAAVFL